MELRSLFTDDDAVSPVIGVILMVAITVILAAVIGTFVLGLGGNLGSQAPSATIDFNYEAGETASGSSENYADNRSYYIEHDGGEEIDNETIVVQEAGTEFGASRYSGNDIHSAGDVIFNRSDTGSANFNPAANPDDTVQVVWSASDSDQSSVLAEDDIPQ